MIKIKNFKHYFVTTVGMIFLIIYYLSKFFEIDFDYLFHITIFVLSSCLIFKLFYFYNFIKSSEKESLLRFSFLILSYFLPIYMIIQEPGLIIDMSVSKISYLIILFFAFIGTLIEKYLFIMKEKIYEDL